MNDIDLNKSHGIEPDLNKPTPLYQYADHAIYWLGNREETAFRCNVYLIADQDRYLLVDPGNRTFFEHVKNRVSQLIDPSLVAAMVLCHQDPDVAASMVDWLDVNPDMLVMTSPRTNVLLPHYGKGQYRFYDICENPLYPLSSGANLRFIESPFLHFPGAFTTYDTTSKYLFSGDIWSALDLNWSLVVDDFDKHVPQMDLFHIDYMASNIAARGYVNRLAGTDIAAILPQHGSVIGRKHLPAALDYLSNLHCGTDNIYADL